MLINMCDRSPEFIICLDAHKIDWFFFFNSDMKTSEKNSNQPTNQKKEKNMVNAV